MKRDHRYEVNLRWTGNTGPGTENYTSYKRSHEIFSGEKLPLELSSDPVFRGDRLKYSPEELFVSALSSCHMLWYLHLCADAGIVVIDYEDRALGIMTENEDGSGQFLTVILKPRVRVKSEAMIEKANRLHRNANEMCFIARSCNFPVRHEPECYC